ncbi:MAG: hypothetical protein IPO15_08200 [Anaerolineae bacterium]|uniref:hypothetical protein n=1 Tax=Candidatus Amarolinea dominans TaxID=3140696 RepID=UPI00313729E1|nr:hypothetical protein [Anaerolineae bacterium]
MVDLDAANNRLLTLDVATTSAQAAVRGPRLTGRLRQPAGAAASVWRLYTIDASSFSLISQTDLRSLTYVPPYTGLDASRQRFIAGYMQRAEVDIYGLDGAAATSTPTATVGAPTATPTRTPTAAGATAHAYSHPHGDRADRHANRHARRNHLRGRCQRQRHR